MDHLARTALEKLLKAADRSVAGVRIRSPVLTASHLATYSTLRSLDAKEAFEAVLKDASGRDAVALMWDDSTKLGFITRVELKDARKLAEFLGTRTAQDSVTAAAITLEPHINSFPVLREVITAWNQLKLVRGLSPKDVQQWLDAINVVQFAGTEIVRTGREIPLRVASTKIFKDSKRIERICGAIDVLLLGSTEATSSDPQQVWQELGLYREEQLVRLAGNVVVERELVCARLDAPYMALSSLTIKGVRGVPFAVLSIENQTNFNVIARQKHNENSLFLYSGGMPSPSWCRAYATLLDSLPMDVPVYHWGDYDEGGFRISARIAKEATEHGYRLQAWKMAPVDVPLNQRVPAKPATIQRMANYCDKAGWNDLALAVAMSDFTVEQEGLLEDIQLDGAPTP